DLVDMRNWRLRQNAVSEIEDERAPGERFQYCLDGAVQCSATSEQHQRVEISLHWQVWLNGLPREGGIDRPIEANGVYRHGFHITQQGRARTSGKSNDFCVRDVMADLGDNPLRRLDAPLMELLCRQYTGPGIENLDRVDPRLQLPNEVAGRRLDQLFDQRAKSLGISIGKAPRRLLLRCANACDHVACHRPRRAAKPKQ